MGGGERKAAILGAGRVGAAAAYRLAAGQLCDELVLVDLDQDKAWAEAADIQDAVSACGGKTRVRAGSYYDCADAALCILAVAARVDEQVQQLDQLDQASAVIGRVVPSLMATGFDGVMLTLSHPVELMTWLVWQLSDLPDTRVLGLGAVLDAARLRLHLARRLAVAPEAVSAPLLGIHDGEQVVLWAHATVEGEPLLSRLPGMDPTALANTIAETTYRLRAVKGAATFGAASATAQVARAVLEDSGETLPVCAALHGEYGVDGVYACAPCVLGARGVRQVVEYPLRNAEQAKVHKIARLLRQYMTDIS